MCGGGGRAVNYEVGSRNVITKRQKFSLVFVQLGTIPGTVTKCCEKLENNSLPPIFLNISIDQSCGQTTEEEEEEKTNEGVAKTFISLVLFIVVCRMSRMGQKITMGTGIKSKHTHIQNATKHSMGANAIKVDK